MGLAVIKVEHLVIPTECNDPDLVGSSIYRMITNRVGQRQSRHSETCSTQTVEEGKTSEADAVVIVMWLYVKDTQRHTMVTCGEIVFNLDWNIGRIDLQYLQVEKQYK